MKNIEKRLNVEYIKGVLDNFKYAEMSEFNQTLCGFLNTQDMCFILNLLSAYCEHIDELEKKVVELTNIINKKELEK